MNYQNFQNLMLLSSSDTIFTYQNYQNLMLLTFSYTKRTMMHLFLFTNSAQREPGFNMYAEYTQLQLTFLALQPWIKVNNTELKSCFSKSLS